MLNTRHVIICMFAILFIFLFRGGDIKGSVKDVDSQKVETKAEDSYEEAIKFMMDNYHFSREILEGLDVERLIQDYRLDELEYTPEEVCQILKDNRDCYLLREEDRLFSMINPPDEIPESRDLKKDDNIIAIGIYENPGSLRRYMLFDLENKVFYIDDPTPHPLSETAVKSLKDIGRNTPICSWKHITNGAGNGTTGSYAWKIVLCMDDGGKCIYGGYTDSDILPEGYDDVMEVISACIDI